MASIWITVKKEIRSILRDKKTLITLLAFPLLIPVMIFLYAYIYEGVEDASKYLIGVDYQPNTTEITLMEEANLEAKVYDDKEVLEKAYSKGEIAGYITYLEDEDKYYLYVNEDSEEGMYVSSYVTTYLEGYNEYLAKLYLIGEDIDVDKAYANVEYEIVDLDGENFILLMMFTVSFTYIVMSIVLATTNMATSATAVEKENGTMETILTFPIKVRDLIVGKYLATVIMGILSSLIGLVLTLGSLEIATNSFEVFEDINFTFDMVSILVAILVVVLASCFIAGLSIAVTSMAKTYKEAQSMSSTLNMLTIIPMFISLMGMEIEKWYYLVPILNYTQVLMDIFSGNLDLISILMVILSSVICVVLVITYILKQYRTERVLFHEG
ncbi:MAG: ABC transporter permease [Bacilli bacterium]|nr:ABC transporter permease [Bacilli bacterium]